MLEEFDYTIKYKPERMHLQADHLSRLAEHVGATPINDRLGDDNLCVVTAQPEWYAGIVEFLTTQQLPVEWSREKRHKVRVYSQHFVVVGNKLFRRGADGLLRRCMGAAEVPTILAVCYDNACGGHFSERLTT